MQIVLRIEDDVKGVVELDDALTREQLRVLLELVEEAFLQRKGRSN